MTARLKNPRPILRLLLLLLFAVGARAESLDLAGSWQARLDRKDEGITRKWFALPVLPSDAADAADAVHSIQLPGLITAQGMGDLPSMETPWTGDGWRYPEMFKEWQTADNFKFPFFLQPPRHYVGPVWFQRSLEIPSSWKNQHIRVFLERVHWQSQLWIDGKPAGKADSLSAPHTFLCGPLKPGTHTLTLRIDNRLAPVNVGPLSHSVTDHTQGNWNGVIGRMELQPLPAARIEHVCLLPTMDGTIQATVTGTGHGAMQITTSFTGPEDSKSVAQPHLLGETGIQSDGAFTTTLRMRLPAKPRPWSEFDPALYEIKIGLQQNNKNVDSMALSTGFRDAKNHEGVLTLNGRRLFLRGTLECCIFPEQGHPPTDVESWTRIIGICQTHGLNHMRFHSWCPPEAAFVAADRLGFYLQVEASSWANGSAQVGSGWPLDAWLDKETENILKAYGHHPSFLLFAYGNEPGGPKHGTWLQDWVSRWQARDPLRLYTTAAGWPVKSGSDYHNIPQPRLQRWGEGMKSIINSKAPNTDFDWSSHVRKHPDAPLVSHEIGQWCVYPNFAEIDKYTGYFKARNFEIFRETARRNGLLPHAEDLLHASGKLQTLAYKHDIEAALRTQNFGGFQLLDLHDFPGQGTALVGVLDAFWGEKGYVSPEEYRRFSGPIVPLARLKKMIFTRKESLEADLQLSHFGPTDFPSLVPIWKLTDGDTVVASGKLNERTLAAGALHDLGKIRVSLADIPAPAKLTLTVGAKGKSFSNDWDVFVYPDASPTPKNTAKTHICQSLPEALKALDEGKSVLWMPHPDRIRNDAERPLQMGFSPVFWNTAWTNWQAPHTLGLLMDPAHPALATFPTDAHSNWQWWEIQRMARPFILSDHPKLNPVVRVIDDWFTNRPLGLVFEAKVGKGKLLACGANLLDESAQRPAARQLLHSLTSYLGSAQFRPEITLKKSDIHSLLTPPSMMEKLGARVTASSEEPGYEARMAVDGNPNTLWHTAFSKGVPAPPHRFSLQFKEPLQVDALLITQRQDRNLNGQLMQVEILDEKGNLITRTTVPAHATKHRIELPKNTRTRKLTLRIPAGRKGNHAAIAEIEILPRGS